MATKAPLAPFRRSELEDLYHLSNWGSSYFEAAEDGNLQVVIGGESVSLPGIVESLRSEGHALPVVLRFPQIIEDRIERINGVFARAISESGYRGRYQGVFPIKVNQRRVVVETVAEYGTRFGTGLEAGSKAELALILVQDIHEDALIQCNGFKDDDFVRLALWGRKLGKNVIITLEKHGELERVLRISREMGVRPAIGARFKLHAKGAGQWEASGGDDAKFGLTAAELIDVANRLKAEGLGDALVMLHCHVGSQLTDIRRIRVAVREAAQAYVDLQKLGTGVSYLNVGGGLAVDYDGSKTSYYVSGNYGLQEYADTVVYAILETCDEVEAPHPTIVSESGRALTAHHAVLVIPVIDAIGPTLNSVELPPLEGEVHSLVRDMREILEDVTVKTYREAYNEAVSNKETMHNLFDLGYLTLLERAHIENLYYRILKRVSKVIESLDYVPEEFETLPRVLADQYVCNFSLFQSLPDTWAIQAMFPIMPIHRLNERPERNATLVDITCDSDGKIEKFIDLRDVKNVLPVHALRRGEPYYLGIFLTGAYQDVLGNAHNLFGRVNEAHIRIEAGEWRLERFVRGQKSRRVIENMGYEAPDLHRWLQETIEEAEGGSRLTAAEAQKLTALYDAELVGYTYLEEVG
ncbi:MAG TPA: biosynthetic arginine decarboxylase [Trueperaceae bacterium]